MRPKQILHDVEQVRENAREGISKIAAIVKRTLGPGGLPIAIERTGQALDGSPLGPMVTKDGVTVAEECFDPNEGVDLFMQSVKAICKKTNKVAGDGTTTAIVLGEAIFEEAMKELQGNVGVNPQKVRIEIEDAAKLAAKLLREMAVPVDGAEDIRRVATISANGDEEIGRIIEKAFQEVGNEGVITVDEGHTLQTEVEVVDGFQIERGVEAQDRFFNNKEKTAFVAKDCHVILYNGAITNYNQLIPAFKAIQDQVLAEGKAEGKGPMEVAFPPVMVVADEFNRDVIQWLLIQRAEAGLAVCAVRSPHMTTKRTAIMDDMAVMLDGKRLGNGNESLESCTYEHIGVCDKVVATKYHTTFYDGFGTEEMILQRIDELKAQKAAAESPYDAQLIADRIAGLGQGIAKIGVGGATELEIKERYHRIEDALNAARAAVEMGIVPGGGTALLNVALRLEQAVSDEPAKLRKNPTLGERILARALRAPLRQIAINVGEKPDEIEERLSQAPNDLFVYDAMNKELVEGFEGGIIDPVKVTLAALENATSIASLLTTCGGGIVFTRSVK